jgi:hypothetical protein
MKCRGHYAVEAERPCLPEKTPMRALRDPISKLRKGLDIDICTLEIVLPARTGNGICWEVVGIGVLEIGPVVW